MAAGGGGCGDVYLWLTPYDVRMDRVRERDVVIDGGCGCVDRAAVLERDFIVVAIVERVCRGVVGVK